MKRNKRPAKPNNPFLLVGYHSPAYFCNRVKETKTLTEAILNERNVTIYAIRRLGKTALIRHVFDTLAQKSQCHLLYVDLMPTNDFNDFTKRLAEAVINEFGTSGGGISAKIRQLLSSIGASVSFEPVSGMPSIDLEMKEPGKITYSLSAIMDFLNNQKKQVIIALDEFQQITHYPETEPEATLRNMIQEYAGTRFIFSGSHTGIMSSIFSEAGRPFFKSTQIMALKTIEKETYTRFIQHHFESNGKTIPEGIVHNLLAWCRRQTYYVQVLCNRLFARYDQVTEEHLKAVQAEVMNEEEAVFHNYKNLLTSRQWQALVAFAQEENVARPNAYSFLHKYRLGQASTVSGTIKSLLDKQLIAYEDGTYFIQDVLLMRWLQAKW